MAQFSILQVADYGGPYAGNFVPALTTLGRTLGEKGWRQVLAFSDCARGRPWLAEVEREATAPVRLVSTAGSPLKRAETVLRIVEEERVDLVHCHFWGWDVAAWLAQLWMAARGRRLRLVWHQHSPTSVPRQWSRPLKDAVKLRLMGRTVHVAVVSQGGFDALAARGLLVNRAVVIPNGVDLARLRRVERTRDEVRRAIGAAPDEPLLLQYGWAPHRKGVDRAVAAVAQLVRGGARVRLALVGERAMRDYVNELCGGPPPPWLSLCEPDPVVTNLLAACDVFLSPSRSEGLPYSVLEAVAAGVPVVTSAIPGMEFAEALPAVAFFRDGTVEGFRRALEAVTGWSGVERARRVAESRRIVEEQFTIEGWARRVAGLYERLLCAA